MGLCCAWRRPLRARSQHSMTAAAVTQKQKQKTENRKHSKKHLQTYASTLSIRHTGRSTSSFRASFSLISPISHSRRVSTAL
jgi:hypothetical protein